MIQFSLEELEPTLPMTFWSQDTIFWSSQLTLQSFKPVTSVSDGSLTAINALTIPHSEISIKTSKAALPHFLKKVPHAPATTTSWVSVRNVLMDTSSKTEAALPTPPALIVNTSTSENATTSTPSAVASINSLEPALTALIQPTTSSSTAHASVVQLPAPIDNIKLTTLATMSQKAAVLLTHSQENASLASANSTNSTPMEHALRSLSSALPDNTLLSSTALPSPSNASTSTPLLENALTVSKVSMSTVESASVLSALKVKSPPNMESSVPTSHLFATPMIYSMVIASAAKTPTTQLETDNASKSSTVLLDAKKDKDSDMENVSTPTRTARLST